MADETIYGVVALPFALWAAQKTVESIFNFRQVIRARYLDTVQLLDDISTNIRNSREHIDALSTELSGSPCPMDGRLAADPRYYVFSVSGELTLKIFETDAVQRYSHLEGELFKRIKQFYDLQAIIAATFASLQTEIFMDLKPDTRKIGVLRKLLKSLIDAERIGSDCIDDLRKEVELINKSPLWKLLLLDHRNFKRLNIRSEGGASSGAPAEGVGPGKDRG